MPRSSRRRDYWFSANVPLPPHSREEWHRVTGGPIPGELFFRLGQDKAGAWIITDFYLESVVPVTSTLLRDLPLSVIVREFLRTNPPTPANTDLDLSGYIERSRGPSKAELEAFARAYYKAVQLDPRRPVTAAAESVNISRATANRWLVLIQATQQPTRKEDT